MPRIFSLLWLLFSFTVGCATLPPPEKLALELKDYELPQQMEKDKALVYVVRPSSLGTLIRFDVYLDAKDEDSKMGYTRGNQYIYFYANPGKHLIFQTRKIGLSLPLMEKKATLFF